MLRFIQFYSWSAGRALLMLGLSLMLFTVTRSFALYLAVLGGGLLVISYLIKSVIPIQRHFEWWLVFPEFLIEKEPAARKKESILNWFMKARKLSLSLAFTCLAIYFLTGIEIFLLVTLCFSCIPLVVVIIANWFYSDLLVTIQPDWSLVFPELAGMYKKGKAKMIESKQISSEEIAGLNLIVRDIVELRNEVDSVKN